VYVGGGNIDNLLKEIGIAKKYTSCVHLNLLVKQHKVPQNTHALDHQIIIMSGEEQFNQAFGMHTGIGCRHAIRLIKDNEFYKTYFDLYSESVVHFTNLSWKLLGRYIANNTHLKNLNLYGCMSTDENMAFFFKELVRSSLRKLDMKNSLFGIVGLRCMISFLGNSPNLSYISFFNSNINSECFEVLVSALHGRPVENLYLKNCNITDISALNTYTLPNLQSISLTGNNIGRQGCITISNLLQNENTTLTAVYLGRAGMGNEETEILANSLEHNTKLESLSLSGNNVGERGYTILSNVLQNEGSNLKCLYLKATGIDDEGAELLASSLENNTKLRVLDLDDNNITERGYIAILKIVVDVSSIENTYNSNNTLSCEFDNARASNTMKLINCACWENRVCSTPRAAGRAKVIRSQLNSQNRKELCELQGIEYIPGSIFANVEPVLLPDILALICWHGHGRSELYRALVLTAPDLLSCIDRKALIKDTFTRVEAVEDRVGGKRQRSDSI